MTESTQSFTNLQAGRTSLNVPLSEMPPLLAKLAANNTPGVVFAQNQGAGGTGTYMIPETATQDNGSAPWVDTSQNLAEMGVPVTLPIYLQIWVESKKNYYYASGVIKDLARGETVNEALS